MRGSSLPSGLSHFSTSQRRLRNGYSEKCLNTEEEGIVPGSQNTPIIPTATHHSTELLLSTGCEMTPSTVVNLRPPTIGCHEVQQKTNNFGRRQISLLNSSKSKLKSKTPKTISSKGHRSHFFNSSRLADEGEAETITSSSNSSFINQNVSYKKSIYSMSNLFLTLSCYLTVVLSFLPSGTSGNLWAEMQNIPNVAEFRHLCNEYTVAKAYMEDSLARITVFVPVDEVFIYNPILRAMDQKQLLSHVVDYKVHELSTPGKWEKQTLIRNTVNSGNVFITQFENNPGNFSYFANNGRLCNHESTSWARISGDQYLYMICSPMGYRAFPGPALDFIRMTDPTYFRDRGYHNNDLRQLRDILERVPDIAIVIFGSSAWNGFHTFFLPTDEAFGNVPDRNRIDREVLLAHVTGNNRVLFSRSWLYDGGIHYYPTIKFTSNVVEDNFKLKLTMRNITDRRTGRWTLYAVSNVYERYSSFRRGSVWAKVLTPNIPVQNGVVHIVDTVLGIVSKTIDQMINGNPQCQSLMQYINTIGQIVRSYFATTGGMITFFAPVNEAFDRIPENVEKRLLRDRLWLEQILKLHIAPGKELTSDQINNDTIINTVDKRRRLYFIKGEWPKNNITYYVIGGGVRASILQDNVAATNGLVHYIDRVLGVPYQTMFDIVQNETSLQHTYKALKNTNLRYTLDPWEVVRPEQNFTFFVPTDEAWEKIPSRLRAKFNDGNHNLALNFVLKRHIIQGQALMLTDLRTRTYVMMNNQKCIIRRNGKYFEIYWPYGNRVARLYEGGQIAGTNGFMHKVDNVLLLEEDLKAVGVRPIPDFILLLFLLWCSHIFARR